MKTEEKICLFDMDGTLCDFEGQMLRDLKKMQSPHEPTIEGINHGVTPDWLENRMMFIKNTPGWWLNLPLLPDGMRIFNLAVEIGFHPEVLTKGPFKSAPAWSEKYLWARQNLDQLMPNKLPVDVTITMEKTRKYGRVLVEDWGPFVLGWLGQRKRGLVVLLDRPYNQDVSHPNIVRYNGTDESLKAVKYRLIDAYNR